jgi:hypothetical protein
LDGCRQAIAESVLPGHVVLHDFCQGAFGGQRRFDLVWSCEFLEHVDEQYLPNILKTCGLATRVIAVTHAFPGQAGHHHVNCQPATYWIKHFESLGFCCAVSSTIAARRRTLKDHDRVNHFARSGLIFVSRSILPTWREDFRRSAWHPSLKAWSIAAGLKLSFDYWQHWRRRHSRRTRVAA